jgi:cardiolipin synthase A/B
MMASETSPDAAALAPVQPALCAEASSGAAVKMKLSVAGNDILLIPSGPERLSALLALIDGARASLELYYYTFASDEAGHAVLEALIDARNRDVAVTLIIDSFGSSATAKSTFDALKEAGARFAVFGHKRSTRYLIRNHQKMTIADRRHALIGGFNIEHGYFGSGEVELDWCDLGVLVEGPLAAELGRWYTGLAQWTFDGKQTFRRLRRLVRHWQPGTGEAQWLMGGPTRFLNGWARRVKVDLESARQLDMVAAYFSPGWGMLRRIMRIARRDGARLILPNKSDNTTTIGAARHLYRRLLKGGVEIHEFNRSRLHMKLLVIDDVVYVGSANFDKRSLFLNVELMLRINDAGVAEALRGLIDDRANESRLIDQAAYTAMAGPVARLRWWVSYLLVGVLDYTVTRRLNFRNERTE